MINNKIMEFEHKLTMVINEAQLPPAVVGLVLEKILNNVNNITLEMVNKEIQDEKKAKQEKAMELE